MENLTLSEGVKNMSPSLPGINGLSVVVYEYVNPSETESLYSFDHVVVVETSIVNPTSHATLPTFWHVATPRPAHTELSVPKLKLISPCSAAVKNFCDNDNIKQE